MKIYLFEQLFKQRIQDDAHFIKSLGLRIELHRSFYCRPFLQETFSPLNACI